MPIDTSIYGQFAEPARSTADYAAQYDAADARRMALQQNALALQKNRQDLQQGQNVLAQRQALTDAVKSGQLNLLDPTHQGRALSLAPDVAPALLKTVQEGQTSAAKAGLDNAQAGKAVADTGQVKAKTVADAMTRLATGVLANPTLANAQRAVIQMAAQHGGDPTDELMQLRQLGENPNAIKQWAAGHAMSAEQLLPKTANVGLGGTMGFTSTNPVTGAVTMTGQQPITQSADNAATQATSIMTTGMTNATSRANNRDTQAGENLRAGMMPGGGLDDNTERTAQAIASGQLPAPNGMALLNPKNQRILGRVMEINPQYDSTTVDAKKTAARSFASGQLGNALRSVSTANAHLDQLSELADALNNGNMQIVNKVGNWYKAQTGNPAPTNFDAIKNIVGQEVVKAIVAGGGGVGEREEAAKTFSSKMSPQQLKEVMQHYRMVMGAQADNLLAQRDAAGLPRSTLPTYNGGAAAAGNVVTTPDGVAHTFPTLEAAAKFKAAAGIK